MFIYMHTYSAFIEREREKETSRLSFDYLNALIFAFINFNILITSD